MYAEFINRPISGQFPEKHFGQVTPCPSWVKFTDKAYQEWVGSFLQGWEGHKTLILSFENEERTFVVTGGLGYMIDITSRKQLNEVELSDIKSVIADIAHKRVIFSDGLNLQCVGFEGHHSILYDKYYFDDIELIEIRDNKLFARYWYYQRDTDPFLFEIDLTTKEIKDTYFDTVNKNIQDSTPSGLSE